MLGLVPVSVCAHFLRRLFFRVVLDSQHNGGQGQSSLIRCGQTRAPVTGDGPALTRQSPPGPLSTGRVRRGVLRSVGLDRGLVTCGHPENVITQCSAALKVLVSCQSVPVLPPGAAATGLFTVTALPFLDVT